MSYMEQHGTRLGRAGNGGSNGHRSQSRSWEGDPAATNARIGELFLATLEDIYSAEMQIIRAIWNIGAQTQSEKLRHALQQHGQETERQVHRLEQVFDMLSKPTRGKPCKAIDVLISEANEVVEKFKGSDALDAGLVSAAQAIEVYQISRYGTLKVWAEELDIPHAASLLDQTLQEKIKTHAILTEIAAGRVKRPPGKRPK
jgi:ferritin-like metal-binding protein YciE